MQRQACRFAVIVPVGPEDRNRFEGLMESLFVFERGVQLVVVIDDTRSLTELTFPPPSVDCKFVVMKPPRAHATKWLFGWSCVLVLMALRKVLDSGCYEFVL